MNAGCLTCDLAVLYGRERLGVLLVVLAVQLSTVTLLIWIVLDCLVLISEVLLVKDKGKLVEHHKWMTMMRVKMDT